MKVFLMFFCMIATLLVSGWITVHINHDVSSPRLDAVSPSSISIYYEFNFNSPTLIRKVIDIRLSDTIHPAEKYRDIGRILMSSSKYTLIKMYISGYGGDADGTSYLMTHVRASRAQVEMWVIGPSYSGHAYLALSGDKLVMGRYALLMLHTSSLYNFDCSIQKGTDRNMSNVDHCKLYKEANTKINDQMIMDMPILTQGEKLAIINGYDVYLLYSDVKKRIGVSHAE